MAQGQRTVTPVRGPYLYIAETAKLLTPHWKSSLRTAQLRTEMGDRGPKDIHVTCSPALQQSSCWACSFGWEELAGSPTPAAVRSPLKPTANLFCFLNKNVLLLT